MAKAELKVMLLRATPDPDEIVALGARLCYAQADIESLKNRVEAADQAAFVSRVMERRPGRSKVSALFTLPHRSGTLHQIMSVFALAGLNMMKLESRPVPGRNWEYVFFVDFSGDLTRPGMEEVLRELSQSAEGFRVLGNYKASEDE